MCNLSDYNELKICTVHRLNLQAELDVWHKHYLPITGNVVDIGAGCGETAQFFLNHGASSVLCIECNEECLSNLHENFKDNPQVIIQSFLVNRLKIDIEGAEKDMLFEVHFPYKFEHHQPSPFTRVELVILRENWGFIFRRAIRKYLYR